MVDKGEGDFVYFLLLLLYKQSNRVSAKLEGSWMLKYEFLNVSNIV